MDYKKFILWIPIVGIMIVASKAFGDPNDIPYEYGFTENNLGS